MTVNDDRIRPPPHLVGTRTDRSRIPILSARNRIDVANAPPAQKQKETPYAGPDRTTQTSVGTTHDAEERAIGAFFLGVSASCLGLSARLAFEVGIDDIVESKGTLQFDRLIARPVRKRVLS